MAEKPDIHYLIDGSGKDGTLQEGDDIQPKIKKTLGDYISELTKKNAQSLKSGFQETSITDEKGNPAALDEQGLGSNNPYAPIQDNPELTKYSDSGLFEPSITSYIKKGEDGNTYTKEKLESTKKGIQGVLSNNRFSGEPGSGFVNNRDVPNTIGTVQNFELGSYRSQGPEIKMDDLQKVGFSLMLRAAGEIKAATEGDPTSFGAGAASLIPGKAQLAIVKVDNSDLRAINAFGSPFKEVGQEKISLSTDVTLGGDENKSWGVLNTPLEPFDGFLPIGMTILGTALTIALTAVTKGIIGLFGLIIKPQSDLSSVPAHGPFISGQFGKEEPANKFFSLKLIGIQSTDRDFIQCVNEGTNVLFGFDGASFKRVAEAPGFYTIFVRNVLRSGNIIINSIKDVFTNNQNPIAAVQSFIGLVDVLKTSKIISFLNILAQIGDRSLELKSKKLEGPKVFSQNNEIPENPATRVMKTRVGRDDLRSTMRTSAVTSKFLFSKEALKASDILSSAGNARLDHAAAGVIESIATDDEMAGNRISTETVEKIEAELDAEYVPFYFHDIRTNEIVGFNAFLDTLEDGYTISYDNEEAYGRVETVKTYKGTERNLTVSFNIVSTNKSDFDVMWWKINKLITMLYPQFSEGRQVKSTINNSNINFVQPFSQIATASPFIRLRIGDLIRSNYSKFNLARLFGIGSQKSENIGDVPTIVKMQMGIAKSIKERMMKNPATNNPIMSGYLPGETAMLMPSSKGYVESKNSLPISIPRVFRTDEKKKLITPNSIKVKIIQSPSANPSLIQSYGEHTVAYYIVKVAGLAGESDELSGNYICSYHDLFPDLQQIATLARGGIEDPTIGNINVAFDTLFGGDDNAIVKSFKSVQGKGLAGFITSFNMFDLAGQTAGPWETTEYGSRAPKVIKINLTFTPVHDITPGLDSSGFTRAVQYPVGNVAFKASGEPDGGNGGGEEKFNKYNIEAFSPFRK